MVPNLEVEPRRLGFGRFGLVYALGRQVALKVDRLPQELLKGEPGIKDEQESYMRLAQGSHEQIPCPYIIPVFYHAPNLGIFLLRTPCDLGDVIHARPHGGDDAPGYRHDPARTARWMGQLCGAVAFLVEKHMLAHGDLRPDNVLVDGSDNLRVTDLAAAVPAGAPLPVACEPWGRKLGALDGVSPAADTYGLAGARTESFALGSFYYSMIRGHYPHARKGYSPLEMMDKFQRKEFPALDPTPEDAIIARCWDGAYADDTRSISALEQEFRNMGDGTEWYRFALEDPDWFAETQLACRKWTESGHFDKLLAKREF